MSRRTQSRIQFAVPLTTVLVAGLIGSIAPALGDVSKWTQPPDTSADGYDVLASWKLDPVYNKVVADDFRCDQSGPITDIHVWGSWLFDQIAPNTSFHLSIHQDVPAQGQTPSHPGALIGSWDFAPGSYTEIFYANVPDGGHEMFYNPNNGQNIGTDTKIYQYNFTIPEGQTINQEYGTIYWLDVQANVSGDTTSLFGWKTSIQHFQDDAAYGDNQAFGQAPSTWNELVIAGNSKDMAFEITTVPEPHLCALMTALVLAGFAIRRRCALRRSGS